MALPRGHALEDHTADMSLHGFGPLLEDAFEEIALALFEVMCANNASAAVLASGSAQQLQVEVAAPSREQLLFQFLNELHGRFYGEMRLIVGRVRVTSLMRMRVGDDAGAIASANDHDDGDDRGAAAASSATAASAQRHDEWILRATVTAVEFDPSCHDVGCEVKAVTMHGLKIEQRDEDMLFHVFAVIDI